MAVSSEVRQNTDTARMSSEYVMDSAPAPKTQASILDRPPAKTAVGEA